MLSLPIAFLRANAWLALPVALLRDPGTWSFPESQNVQRVERQDYFRDSQRY